MLEMYTIIRGQLSWDAFSIPRKFQLSSGQHMRLHSPFVETNAMLCYGYSLAENVGAQYYRWNTNVDVCY